MSDERIEKRELTPLETQLQSLVPGAAGLDRDQLMFLAGRASAELEVRTAAGPRRGFGWRVATAASVLVAIVSVWWSANRSRQFAENIPPGKGDRSSSSQALVPADGGIAQAPIFPTLVSRAARHNATGDARAYLQMRDQLMAGRFEPTLGIPDQEGAPAGRSKSLLEIRGRFLPAAREAF